MEGAYLMISKNKVKDKWECEKLSSQVDSSCGSTWPPKNYNCNFCKREFRSALALGGHMNVHRRDRARLRLLPSPVLEYPNPKPSFSPSSPSKSSVPFTNPKSLLSPSVNSISSPSAPFTNEEKKRSPECPREGGSNLPCGGTKTKRKNMTAAFGAAELKVYAQKRHLEVLKNKEEVISLDLEMGLKDTKEVLDLELRLGYY